MGIDTGTFGMHITKDDKRLIEKHDLDQKQKAKAYHQAVKDMDRFREIQTEKEKEIRKEASELKRKCEKWDLDIYDYL